MITFFIFLFILGILIIVHEGGHFFAAKKVGVRVEEFSLGFGPKLLKRKKDDTEYSVCAIPLGGYVKLAGDNLEEYKGKSFEYLAQPPGRRFWIIFCGPLLNYVLGILCFWFVFFAGYPVLTSKVGGLVDGFGAKDAGIEIGDQIIAVDGKKVTLWEDLQRIIQAKKAPTIVQISLLRDNQEHTINVQIKEKDMDDSLGGKQRIGLLGITPYDETVIVKHGLFQSLLLGVNKAWRLTAVTCKAVGQMVMLKLSIRQATGPLGIFFITSKIAKEGLIAILNLIGIISVSLAIFNILPLPVLDGGHIFLLAIEKIRGKYLSLKAEQIVTQIGFTLIITLAIIVTYNDIVRLFGDKIAKLIK